MLKDGATGRFHVRAEIFLKEGELEESGLVKVGTWSCRKLNDLFWYQPQWFEAVAVPESAPASEPDMEIIEP